MTAEKKKADSSTQAPFLKDKEGWVPVSPVRRLTAPILSLVEALYRRLKKTS